MQKQTKFLRKKKSLETGFKCSKIFNVAYRLQRGKYVQRTEGKNLRNLNEEFKENMVMMTREFQ